MRAVGIEDRWGQSRTATPSCSRVQLTAANVAANVRAVLHAAERRRARTKRLNACARPGGPR
jgi:hypothetical protein